MGGIKNFIINITLFLILDIIWLKFIIGNFFNEILQPIARMKEGSIDIDFQAALVVYVLMSLALNFFVLRHRGTTFSKVTHAAFLGLVIYGIFDFTNVAFIKGYPVEMLYVDVGWGTFLFAAVAYVRCRMAPKRLFS